MPRIIPNPEYFLQIRDVVRRHLKNVVVWLLFYYNLCDCNM
jgi:hypothetical protein